MSLALYMDVHVPRAVTVALRLRGIDVVTAQQDGAAEWDDEQLLERATELGRILVSQDEDILREGARRLKDGREFSGIVYAHQLRVTTGQMVQDLELIAAATDPDAWRSRIEILAYRMRQPFTVYPMPDLDGCVQSARQG